MSGTNLQEAKRNQNDEFYTQISDIEKELNHYRDQFKDKHIFMNCDDPEESNFWMYFYLNFDFLSIKKITSTHYHESKPTYRLDYDGKEVVKTPLEQNGDFRSPEAIEILREADIVITNPPFSLYREYVSQLISEDKDFIIIGNYNSVNYKEIFPLLNDGKMWIGQSSGTMEFIIPNDAPVRSAQRIDEDGVRYQKFGNISWFTNMEVQRRSEDIVLYKEYNKEDYPKYDNYDAINVNRVNEIPKDYYGVMGVPITFLNRHNPEQFNILGLSQKHGYGLTSKVDYQDFVEIRPNGEETGSSGRKTNGNPVMEGKPKRGNYYLNKDTGKIVHSLYGRIFIQRKDHQNED